MMSITVTITSLIYGILITAAYFSKKRIDSIENKLYSIILLITIAMCLLDIESGVFYLNDMYTSTFFYKVLVKVIFTLYGAWDIAMLSYIIAISTDKELNTKKIINNTVFGILLFGLIELLLPFEIYAENGNAYPRGLAVSAIFLLVIILVVCIMIILIKNMNNIINKKYLPLVFYLLFCILMYYIQSISGILLMTSVISFVTILMYFTIENPDVRMIEQLNIAKNEAEKANRAKSDFLSSMSHEIRTPLNAIVGLSEDIGSFSDQVPAQVAEDAKDIISASDTLLEIVGNILDISKIESNKMTIIETKYNFVETVEQLAKIDATRIGDKPIDFKINIAEDIPYELYGDKIHVKEIINNLLTNAIKYTEKGTVSLTINCINNDDICNLIISVQDTGRGIKAENIEKLFTKFERLDVERNTTAEGTGLGLAITKKLVEMMGGKINVQSQFGVGSIFMVQLPQKISQMSKPYEVEMTPLIIDGVEEKKIDGKKVLIVDDNKLNIKVAQRALANFNLNLKDCTSGQECLDLINNGEKFDLILMDIMMPGMSGDTTLQKLKENPEFNTPVIALTADAVAGAKEKYIESGFVDYIAKPFSREQIKEKLDKIFK